MTLYLVFERIERGLLAYDSGGRACARHGGAELAAAAGPLYK
jgi:hypothetical protein